MKKITLIIFLCGMTYMSYAQLALGIGPTYNISKGNSPRYGLDISLKYYFFKKKPVIQPPALSTRYLTEQILNDSLYGSVMRSYIEYKLAEHDSLLESTKQKRN